MTCPRCSGLMIDNYGEVKCVNCGYFKYVSIAKPCKTDGCANIPVEGTVCGVCIAKRNLHWKLRPAYRGRYKK